MLVNNRLEKLLTMAYNTDIFAENKEWKVIKFESLYCGPTKSDIDDSQYFVHNCTLAYNLPLHLSFVNIAIEIPYNSTYAVPIKIFDNLPINFCPLSSVTDLYVGSSNSHTIWWYRFGAPTSSNTDPTISLTSWNKPEDGKMILRLHINQVTPFSSLNTSSPIHGLETNFIF